MAKVTSKLQVTIPKALAERYGIRPGDDIGWEAAGQFIRVVPASRRRLRLNTAERLSLFDAATERQRQREAGQEVVPAADPALPVVTGVVDRGWTRDELYVRGNAD